ncbi:MAG: transcription-repair coupling factor [Flavobacteriaceae bacterium]
MVKKINSLLDKFDNLESQEKLKVAFSANHCTHVKGLVGSGLSFRIAAAFKNLNQSILFIHDSAEKAAYFLNDFEYLVGSSRVNYFPSSFRQPYAPETTDNSKILLRSEALKKLNSSNKERIIVTYTQAIFEKIISQKNLKKISLRLKKNKKFPFGILNESLFEMGFDRVDFVSSPGEFAVRGGIIDVFSFAYQHPYRIEFFDETIERLSCFDVVSQRSISNFEEVELLPNISDHHNTDERKIFTSFFSDNTCFIYSDFDKIMSELDKMYKNANSVYDKIKTNKNYPPENLFVNSTDWIKSCQKKSIIVLEKTDKLKAYREIFIKQSPQPSFNKKFDLLVNHLNENKKRGFTNTVFCSNENQAKRFRDIFEEMKKTVHYNISVNAIFEGFEDLEAKWCCFTDHQIFERYHKYRLKSDLRKKNTLSLKELTQMDVGDYVTHIDHGIGTFGGLQYIDVEGKLQESIKLIYADRDVLYLSVHSLHKISRYAGKDGKVPKIYKLGSKAWKALKQKTKKRVKEIAFDLIELYAKRKQKIGFSFNPDSYLQWELESSFLFEDTPDQEKATKAIKRDMELNIPMDRLVCGDVGFGKTEVAIRAAFKAVDNSKQVVVLVPTTILAFQHFKTFSKRLEEFPVKVDYLNRFRSTKDKTKILNDLSLGKIDILIGTHQLVNKKILFKDLGLLIVDEEQKFGVAVKEKIRSIKENIDVLTLTATPIPRTLQFSLMSARDLSVINTPPPNRYPIESEIIRFNSNLIKDAILYELQRKGQVFFIHNRVENIMEISSLLQQLVPDARIAVGHGRMEGRKLEEVLLNFMNGNYDILVATTIIENGLDVPNANTMFINNSHNFGLSDLHQMRGRVGRSNKKAFCYFITPPLSSMSSDSQKRIKTVEQFSNLGSGIQIAMKDLEIRGAGDLLGGEQSGFINEMGFDTYQKILQQAIEELKENEFNSVYSNDVNDKIGQYVDEIQIDTDLEIYIPDYYINIVRERLALYQELSKINNDDALEDFKNKLKDRFGPLPKETKELLETVRLKRVASKLGIERIVLKKGICLCYFIADQKSKFYESENFDYLINQIKKGSGRIEIKQKKTSDGVILVISISEVKNIKAIIILLQNLLKES